MTQKDQTDLQAIKKTSRTMTTFFKGIQQNSALNNLKYTMNGIKQFILHEKLESETHNQEKKNSVKTGQK